MRAINRRNRPDNQALEIRYFKGFNRQDYINALFRAIRDVERGALKDYEIDDNTGTGTDRTNTRS